MSTPVILAAVAAVVVTGALAQTAPSAPMAASAPADGSAPRWAQGERWTYRLEVAPDDNCSKQAATGQERVVSVDTADDKGYSLTITTAGKSSKQQVGADLSMITKVGFNDAKGDWYGFPIRTGKTWPSATIGVSGFGTVRTDLVCEHLAPERLSVPAGEFEVIPIACKGQWENISYRSSDSATFRYWYAPALRQHVRSEVFTMYQGRPCVNTRWSLVNPA